MRKVAPIKRITYEERKQIEKLIKEGLSCGLIAKQLGRSKNGIVVEVRRNGKENYNAKAAQKDADTRFQNKIKKGVKVYKTRKVAFHMKQRIENLEMQIEILHETIKELMSR